MRKVPIVAPQSRENIERIATLILRGYQPACLAKPTPFDVEHVWERIVSDFGFQYEIADLGFGVEGLTDPIKKQVMIPERVYNDMCEGKGRARFAVTHEIAHVVIHSDQVRELMVNRGSKALARRGDFPIYRDPEWQANALAAAMLMPEAAVRQIVDTGGGAGEIAKRLKVSREAAKYRLDNLGFKR